MGEIGYDPESDLENPTSSVFCAHGAGFVVPWNQVEEYMHVESIWEEAKQERPDVAAQVYSVPAYEDRKSFEQEEKELREIFERTYGSAKRPKEVLSGRVTRTYSERPIRRHRMVPEKEYLLVDGYNIIFAWEDLKELAEVNIDGARTKLMDILCNYQGYKKCVLILVFDAYKVEGHECEVTDYHNIHVVYTKEAETADQYIEKVCLLYTSPSPRD